MQNENKKKRSSRTKTDPTKGNDALKREKPTKTTKTTKSKNKKVSNKKTTDKKKTKSSSNTKYGKYSKITPPVNAEPIKISFLGGINEVGKNMTCYQYNKSMFIVDCGLAFPETDQLGVDFVIPDFTYVEKNADLIKGVVITHGHEDHIGALCYLLKKINVPVYATLLTAGLIKGKLAEHSIEHEVTINVIKAGDEITLGDFSVEFIKVNHSIPDAVALAIKCDSGVIVQTGDFKIDTSPIDGGIIDLSSDEKINDEFQFLFEDTENFEKLNQMTSKEKFDYFIEHYNIVNDYELIDKGGHVYQLFHITEEKQKDLGLG